MTDVRNKMARGAIWMLLFKLVDRSIGLVSTLILARVLAPQDFGVVAMATSFIGMLELIGAFGFDTALIQREHADESHFNTAWTFNVIVNGAIGTLMVVFALPISHFFNNPGLVPVVCVLAIGSIAQGFENIGVVAFRKDMDFRKEFRFLTAKKLVPFPITIALAFLLHNYWALVVTMVGGRLFGVWISYQLHPYRPRFSLAASGDLLHFSKWLLLVNFLGFLKIRMSDFVVGRVSGAHALGLFNVSNDLANMPGTELVAPINRAVYPAYARIANDRPALQREYLYVMGTISLIAVPAVAGIAATAALIVPVVLGGKWLEAVGVLQLLAFYGISQVIQSNTYSVYLALGRADFFARLNAVHVLALAGALLWLVPARGLMGAAYALLLAAGIMLPITLAMILRTLGIGVLRLLAVLWRPIAAAVALFLVVSRFSERFADEPPGALPVGPLLAAVALGVATYVLAIALFWWLSGRPVGAETSALGAARQAWERVRSKVSRTAT